MITTFGEIMMRFSPASVSERIVTATSFEIRPGGSESNVAIALANLGEKAAFVTVLPENPISNKVIRHLKGESVDTSNIKIRGERIGTYWTENGSGPRSSYVIYDRDFSAFSKLRPEDFSWDEILNKTQWFHFSGISPAVGENVAILLTNLIKRIKIPYSVDLNFRNKLWKWVKRDKKKIKLIMSELCSNASLIAGNEFDFQDILGFNSNSSDEAEIYSDIANQCFELFSDLKYIAISNRVSHSANNNEWGGYLFVKNSEKFFYKSMVYKIDSIQDRVGTGDSFVAGVIYGLNKIDSMNWQQIINFATTLGALNHTTKGDASNFSADEVLNVIKTSGSGRIDR